MIYKCWIIIEKFIELFKFFNYFWYIYWKFLIFLCFFLIFLCFFLIFLCFFLIFLCFFLINCWGNNNDRDTSFLKEEVSRALQGELGGTTTRTMPKWYKFCQETVHILIETKKAYCLISLQSLSLSPPRDFGLICVCLMQKRVRFGCFLIFLRYFLDFFVKAIIWNGIY